MQKAKKYDWKDSNIALFGSDTERKVKKDSAESEPAWEGAGSEVGVKVWRIVKFAVTDWPEDQYGEFYNGDSYIILNTYKKPDEDELLYDVHFWIGKYSTQDEYGTAAYKTVELDTFLDDKPIQHREVQGHESSLFKTYFSNFTLLKGGADTGFKRVLPEAYKPRMLHVMKQPSKSIVCQEVSMRKANLKSEDVFIIDIGTTIYQWNGSQCTRDEKYKAAQEISRLKSTRGNVRTEILEEGHSDVINKYLSDKPNNTTSPAANPWTPTLFKITNESGSMKMDEVKRGDEICKSDLDTNDVFVLDTGIHLFVWVGNSASVDERKNGFGYASNYLNKTDHPFLPITVVAEGKEILYQTLLSGVLSSAVTERNMCGNIRLTGPSCKTTCTLGNFNPYGDCSGLCHCNNLLQCRVTDGVCMEGGCSDGWTGPSCNDPCPPGYYGAGCRSECRCLKNEVCDHVSGWCEKGCAPGYKGISCHIVHVDETDTLSPSIWASIGVLIGVVVISIIVLVTLWYRSTYRVTFTNSVLSLLKLSEDHKKNPRDITKAVTDRVEDAKSQKSEAKSRKSQARSRISQAKSRKSRAKSRRGDSQKERPCHKSAAGYTKQKRFETRASSFTQDSLDSYTWIDDLSYDTLCKMSKLSQIQNDSSHTRRRGPPETMRLRLHEKIAMMEEKLHGGDRSSCKRGAGLQVPSRSDASARASWANTSQTTPKNSLSCSSRGTRRQSLPPGVYSLSGGSTTQRDASHGMASNISSVNYSDRNRVSSAPSIKASRSNPMSRERSTENAPPHPDVLPIVCRNLDKPRLVIADGEPTADCSRASTHKSAKQPTIRVHARIGKEHYVVQRPLKQVIESKSGADAPCIDGTSASTLHRQYDILVAKGKLQRDATTEHNESNKQGEPNALLRVSVQAIRKPPVVNVVPAIEEPQSID